MLATLLVVASASIGGAASSVSAPVAGTDHVLQLDIFTPTEGQLILQGSGPDRIAGLCVVRDALGRIVPNAVHRLVVVVPDMLDPFEVPVGPTEGGSDFVPICHEIGPFRAFVTCFVNQPPASASPPTSA